MSAHGVTGPGFPATRKEQAKLIEHMLSEIESDLEQRGTNSDFIESVRAQFDERGMLTDKQIDAIKKFYERI